MEYHLYLSLIPESLVVSMLPAPDGTHMVVGRIEKEPGVDLLNLDTMKRIGGTNLPFAPYALAWTPEAPPPAAGGEVDRTGQPGN